LEATFLEGAARMPHVIVKLYPGRTEEQKKRLVKAAVVSQASSFGPPASSRLHVSIYKSRTTPDYGLRRGFSTP
jgi:hypothetical protein